MTTLDKDSPNMMRIVVDPILAKYHVARSHKRHRGIKRVTARELRDLLTGAGFTCLSIEQRTIPRNYGSPEEFLMHVEERAEPEGTLNDIPDDVRENIRREIIEEFRKRQMASTGFANVTLFAVATKPYDAV